MENKAKLRIALLSGGRSSERDVSLKSGDQVYAALDKGKYDVLRYDPKTDLQKLVADADKIDAALIILHGIHGEDGTLQGMLDLLHIPYQGSGVLGSALSMNKLAAKRAYESAGIPTAPYAVIYKSRNTEYMGPVRSLGWPVVIKPASGGSSIGMSIAKTEDAFPAAIENGFNYDATLLIEAFIDGTEVTCAVLGNDDALTTLPLVEIVPGKGYDFFDYEAKYKPGATQEICPARVDESIAHRVREHALKAHQALFLKGYSRSDFIIQGENIYILETNTIPGMTPNSLFPIAAKAAGISFSALLDRLIELALAEHRTRK